MFSVLNLLLGFFFEEKIEKLDRPKKKLTKSDLNPKLLDARYAVRGVILQKALQLLEKLKQKDHGLPFKKITFANIGNPQRLMQQPLSFVRNVLALTESPQLLNHPLSIKLFNKDEIERAKNIVKSCPGVLGGYTHSQGLDFIRKHVCEFIRRRDIVPEPPIDRIFLTDGASIGIQQVMFSLIRGKKDGIMIPIPQYPLYSASLTLYGGTQVSFYLNEETGWSISKQELERAYLEGTKQGVIPRALVVINPGNPTGQVISKSDMMTIIRFCFEKNLVLLSDEVYQDNVYDDKCKWFSANRVVHELGKKYIDHLEYVSFHSTSKGFFGECGRRGGYMHFSKGFNADVIEQMYKRASINLCPNIDGQIIIDCMVCPPKIEDKSYVLFQKQKNDIIQSLKRRSIKLAKAFNGLPNMRCNHSEGAMYAFPQIILPKKAVEEAKKNNLEPDTFYCIQLLSAVGICVVSGSGFCQKEGTFHFRSTILPQEDVFDDVIKKYKEFHTKFIKKYK